MPKQHLTPRLNRLEPNVIIDGGMEIWPEGTSRSVVNNSTAYGAVLFQCFNTSSGITLTNAQQSSIPSGTDIPFSNQISKTSAGTLAAGTNTGLAYFIEGYDVQRMYNNSSSLIFWVKSSVASNRSISFRNVGNTHSYVQQYNIASINTWQLVVVSIPSLNTCPGTINRTNDRGLVVTFPIVSGSTFQTSTLNAWQSGLYLSGISEDSTWLTGTTHDFSIAGVMVLPGDWSSLKSNTNKYTFLRAGKNFQEELAMTQRYYEKSLDLGAVPGLPQTTQEQLNFPSAIGNLRWWISFKVNKRITNPTFLTYSPVTGIGPNVRDSAGADRAQINDFQNESGARLSANGLTGVGASWYWTADARF